MNTQTDEATTSRLYSRMQRLAILSRQNPDLREFEHAYWKTRDELSAMTANFDQTEVGDSWVENES